VPAVPKTSRQAIVKAAQALIEEGGVDALSMVDVAARVGIRSPSLYKHFSDKTELLRAVETETFAELGELLEAAGPDLFKVAEAYLDFARTYPGRYGLLFSLRALESERAIEVRLSAQRSVLQGLTSVLGTPEAALLRSRVVTAFIHGYALMGAAGAFRMGGDTEAVFPAGMSLLMPEISR
jgi:AcrR family transcriptional regulator